MTGLAAALIGRTTTAIQEKTSPSITWSDNARIPSKKMTDMILKMNNLPELSGFVMTSIAHIHWNLALRRRKHVHHKYARATRQVIGIGFLTNKYQNLNTSC